MLLDKQISDYRWEIINVADKISNSEHVSKECLKHALATYAKYEAGELNIRASVIIELKKIYNCSYDDFFDGLDIKI